MIVRKAQLADAGSITKIEQESIPHPWSKVLFDADLKNPNAIYFVAEDDEVIGFIGAHDIVGEVNITNVAVAPIHRRKGAADMLMNALIDEIDSRSKQKEIIGITLEVRAGNKAAISLYEKYGFKTEGCRKGYYSDGEDALIMWKRYGTVHL